MEIVTNIIRAVVFFNSVYMPFFILYRHFDSYGALKDFNNIITEQNKTITKLHSRVERLEKEKWNPYRQIWDLRMQLYQMEQSIESNFTERLGFLENSTTGAIAFQAYYGDRDIIPVNIGEGSIVTFSDVPLNHGKGFNCSSGTFVVPAGYSGLYLFSMHLLVQNGEYPPFQLRRGNYSDSITLCNAVASHANTLLGDSPGMHGDVQIRLGQSTVSCSALANVKEGDRIYVWYPSKNYIPLSTQPQQSSFSGLFVKSRQKARENENIYD